MIIGINGKIGSGKDTVGKIIQLLSEEPDLNQWKWNTEQDILHDLNVKPADSCQWEIKKFADKLKDIVCLLLGCTREQLEDREFKEKELGEEWWYYTTGIDSLGTPSQMYLLDEFPYHISKAILVKLTPRKLLQLLGTEAGRDIIHPNIWVNALMSNYKIISTTGLISGNKGNLIYPKPIYSNWIITDMRFPNELKAIEDRDGITIRIERGDSTNQLGNLHPSETALDDATFDYVIYNNGTIEELVSKVREILINENVL